MFIPAFDIDDDTASYDDDRQQLPLLYCLLSWLCLSMRSFLTQAHTHARHHHSCVNSSCLNPCLVRARPIFSVSAHPAAAKKQRQR